jgi:hypothetical protein
MKPACCLSGEGVGCALKFIYHVSTRAASVISQRLPLEVAFAFRAGVLIGSTRMCKIGGKTQSCNALARNNQSVEMVETSGFEPPTS